MKNIAHLYKILQEIKKDEPQRHKKFILTLVEADLCRMVVRFKHRNNIRVYYYYSHDNRIDKLFYED